MQSLTELYNDYRAANGPRRGVPMSHREAARRAGDEGKYETLRKIGTGRTGGDITEETVEALVRLGLDEAQVRRAAGLQQERSPGPFQLPQRANRLNPSQRQVVIAVVDAILAAMKDSHAADGAARGALQARGTAILDEIAQKRTQPRRG